MGVQRIRGRCGRPCRALLHGQEYPIGHGDPQNTTGPHSVYVQVDAYFHPSFISAIFDVLNVRGTTNAINPIAGKSEHLVEVPNRILRNGMEQFLLHAIGLLALTTYLDETCMSAIPVLVSMFFVGRVFYSLGFKSSERNRGFGFFITFLPTLITYGYCLYKFATTYLL